MAGCNRVTEQASTPGRKRGYAGTWPPRTTAQAGGYAPTGFDARPSLVQTLRDWVRAEAGPGRVLPWGPVAVGTGIAFYFAAGHGAGLGGGAGGGVGPWGAG